MWRLIEAWKREGEEEGLLFFHRPSPVSDRRTQKGHGDQDTVGVPGKGKAFRCEIRGRDQSPLWERQRRCVRAALSVGIVM